ncbi:hypothetical protein ASAP_2519 [Asaia bogorensis]|uniref:Uncharacterized protein n=3 Tax=Asaia TaxID=91914 RepID=A0A060QHC5_9PROT|nr:hypothetical protein ASAP_2519 [Asaia bogorensis]
MIGDGMTQDTASPEPRNLTHASSPAEQWWKIPGAPPDVGKFVEACEALLGSGDGISGLKLVLETMAVHQDEWKLSMAGASLILRFTTRYDIVGVLLRNVIRLQPDNVPAQAFSAHLQIVRGDVSGGCASFAQMMATYPGQKAEIGEFISMSLLEVGYPAEALAVLKSLFNDGDETASLLNNAGCALERLNRSVEALPWYEKALRISPERKAIAFGYACTLIKAGLFERGWPLYFERELQITPQQGWVRSIPRLRPDTGLSGKRILVFQEQGLGDTIQFIRHLSALAARGAEIHVCVPASLVRLVRQSYPALTVLDPVSAVTNHAYDYACPVPDLPFISGVRTVHDIPTCIPYITDIPADRERMAALLPAGRPRIGLVWAGERRLRSEYALADMRRSISFSDLAEALLPAEATFVNLQFGTPREELKNWGGQTIHNPMSEVRDMADTAAIMRNLDLIISVDTSPAHLAGALGCPVWLISRWDACWRWGDSGTGSPWYPTMRIFRSNERSFLPVLQEVGKALRLWIDMRGV